MNPTTKTLTPTAILLRREIIASPATLFTRTRPYRSVSTAPLAVDPRGDAAHLTARLRDESDGPAHADRILTAVADSIPPSALEDLGVTRDGLAAALRAAAPARPVYSAD